MPIRYPIPASGFIERLTRVPRAGETRWIDTSSGRLYTWDGTHGEFEVFNERGRHLGAVSAQTGDFIKPAVRGRKIDV